MEIIFRFLSDIDQLCLALSCKPLRACYTSYIGRRGICPLSTLPRTELLPRLQNDRWVYCGGCRNLHRYSKWWPLCVQKPPLFDFGKSFQGRDPLSRTESKQGKSKILQRIPSIVFETIFQFLSDLDQVCLALSCKCLLIYYNSYTKQRGVCPQEVLPRTALLHRLQNEGWVYCCACERLHLYSRRRPLLFVKKCKSKPSIPNCKAWCFIENAGKANLCLCSSITFHQKVHPKDYIQSQKWAIAYSTTSQSWSHSCTFRHPLARVLVQTQV